MLFTEEEDNLLRSGVMKLSNHSYYSVLHRRRKLGIAKKCCKSTPKVPWTSAEDELLLSGRVSLPGRTRDAIKMRRLVLGLKLQDPSSPWTDEDVKFLRENMKKISNAEIAKALSRTRIAVSQKASSLGIGWGPGKAKEWMPRGENSHRWRGGSWSSYNYGRDWTDYIRPRIIVRDGNRCKVCKFSGSNMNVHHIIPFFECLEHVDSNLVTLCSSCHKWCENCLSRQIMQHAVETDEFDFILMEMQSNKSLTCSNY